MNFKSTKMKYNPYRVNLEKPNKLEVKKTLRQKFNDFFKKYHANSLFQSISIVIVVLIFAAFGSLIAFLIKHIFNVNESFVVLILYCTLFFPMFGSFLWGIFIIKMVAKDFFESFSKELY
jgi:hypothetical protein